MEKLRTFVSSKENPLSVIGPILVVAAITILWSVTKAVSPLLPAAGLIGLLFSWSGSHKGLWISQGLILLALAASIWMMPIDFYWQSTFALSLSLSLLVTYLSQSTVVEASSSKESVLQELSATLESTQQQVVALQGLLNDKDVFLGIARDELLHLQKQQRDWSNAVFQQKQKTAQLEETLEDQILDMIDSPEYRRLNGAYTQLKEQFKEKDRTLVDTRKELFHAQESTMALSQELDEFKLYGVPSEIAQLERHCVETEREAQEEIERLRAEIKHLEKLVSTEKE